MSDWSGVNASADQFERAWKQGRNPRIEDYLDKVDQSRRPPLLWKLGGTGFRRRAAAAPESQNECLRALGRGEITGSHYRLLKS